MYILAKPAEKNGVTIHGMTEDEGEMTAWQAAGLPVFDVDYNDMATYDPYQPLKGFEKADSEAQ